MNKLKNITDKIVNNYIEQADKDFDKVIRKVNNEMYREATNMYTAFIKQYYMYETQSYIRHWEGRPGTRQGQNLYTGRKNIIKKSKPPMLIIDTTLFSRGMADDYQYDSAYDVMQNVMAGDRGVPGKWTRTWYGDYNGKLFSYSGTMQNAFDIFNKHFDDIANHLFYKEWRFLGYK